MSCRRGFFCGTIEPRKELRLCLKLFLIRDLKNTNAISQRCHETAEPIFVTKNGYGDMVIMSMEAYEHQQIMNEVYAKLATAEAQHEAEWGDLLLIF